MPLCFPHVPPFLRNLTSLLFSAGTFRKHPVVKTTEPVVHDIVFFGTWLISDWQLITLLNVLPLQLVPDENKHTFSPYPHLPAEVQSGWCTPLLSWVYCWTAGRWDTCPPPPLHAQPDHVSPSPSYQSDAGLDKGTTKKERKKGQSVMLLFRNHQCTTIQKSGLRFFLKKLIKDANFLYNTQTHNIYK